MRCGGFGGGFALCEHVVCDFGNMFWLWWEYIEEMLRGLEMKCRMGCYALCDLCFARSSRVFGCRLLETSWPYVSAALWNLARGDTFCENLVDYCD